MLLSLCRAQLLPWPGPTRLATARSCASPDLPQDQTFLPSSLPSSQTDFQCSLLHLPMSSSRPDFSAFISSKLADRLSMFAAASAEVFFKTRLFCLHLFQARRQTFNVRCCICRSFLQ